MTLSFVIFFKSSTMVTTKHYFAGQFVGISSAKYKILRDSNRAWIFTNQSAECPCIDGINARTGS